MKFLLKGKWELFQGRLLFLKNLSPILLGGGGGFPKGKNLLPVGANAGSKFFSLRVPPFWKGLNRGGNRKSQKLFFLCLDVKH